MHHPETLEIYFLGGFRGELEETLAPPRRSKHTQRYYNKPLEVADGVYSMIITAGDIYKFRKQHWAVGRVNVSHIGVRSEYHEPSLQVKVTSHDGTTDVREISSIMAALEHENDDNPLIVYVAPRTKRLAKRDRYPINWGWELTEISSESS